MYLVAAFRMAAPDFYCTDSRSAIESSREVNHLIVRGELAFINSVKA